MSKNYIVFVGCELDDVPVKNFTNFSGARGLAERLASMRTEREAAVERWAEIAGWDASVILTVSVITFENDEPTEYETFELTDNF